MSNKFMPDMYLNPQGFTNSACESFIKNKERIKKLQKQ